MSTARLGSYQRDDCDRWIRCPGTLTATQADSVTILSLPRGKYFRLSGYAFDVWAQLVRGDSYVEVTNRLRSQGADDASAATRVAAILNHLCNSGFLIPRTHEGHTPAVPVTKPTSHQQLQRVRLWSCVFLLVRVWFVSRCFGLAVAIERFASRPVVPVPDVTALQWLMTVNRQVALAATLLPLRLKCLELSLTIVHLARRHGVDARLRLAVVTAPFQGHAWAEFNGTPINENRDNIRLYSVFEQLDHDLGIEARRCS